MSKPRLMKFVFVPALLLTMMFSSAVYAASPDPSVSQDSAKIQKLVDLGLSQDNASKEVRLEDILKKMVATGQKVEYINNQVQIVDPPNMSEGISKQDEKFVVDSFTQFHKHPIKSHEQRMADLKQQMKVFPGRSKYRVDYSDGSWIQATSTLEKVNPATGNTVKLFGNVTYPNESEYGSGVYYPGDGEYNHTFTVTENVSGYAYTASNFITVNYTVSNNEHHVHINDASGGQNASGMINIQNAGHYVNVADTDYSVDPTTWCEAENQVVFAVTGSVGVSLDGFFSISVNAGYTWTQYAVTRESLVAQHDYDAYYKPNPN